MFFLLLLTLLVTLITYIVINYVKALNFWKNKDVKYIKPLPLIGNTLPTLTGVSVPDFLIELYNTYPKERYCGIHQFGTPILMLRDTKLAKTIFIKEFESFSDHAGTFNEDVDPLWGKNLFATNGKKWKELRQTLSPAFTSSKMKSMFILAEECTIQFMDYLKSQNEDILEVELGDIIRRYTADVIATTVYGITSNSLKEKENEFIRMGKELTDFTGLKKFKFLMYDLNPIVTKVLNIKIVNDRVGNFFRSIVTHTMNVRARENIIRPDLIHLLMEAKKGRLEAEETNEGNGFATTTESNLGTVNKQFGLDMTDDDMAAQAMVFFLGGYDTTALLINFCLYEIVANPEVQEKLIREVDDNVQKYDGKINYEGLFKMKYLDMVVTETLRKWPAALFLDRKSTRPFTIMPDRENEKPVYLEQGQRCWIPVFAIHRDPQYWPEPEKFNPDRFSEENRSKINLDSFLPFGSGPRNCIGSRYALMVSKLVIFYILKSFEIVPTQKTHIPLEILPENILITPKHGFWFGFKRRDANEE